MQDKDDRITSAAIGSLAYLSADVVHHVFGHGAACLALGGTIRSLSSIFVDCTLTGSAIDLAGPAANLALGALALALVLAARRLPRRVGLFFVLVAAFNVYWFAMQMVFSVATNTDDWAWPMHEYGIGRPVRIGLICLGALAYHQTTRFVGRRLGASDRRDARRIAVPAWLAAGVVACLTAALDHHPIAAVALHAAPQSLALSIGLLFAPRFVPRGQPSPPPIRRSVPWITAAIVFSILSITFLGRGVTIAFP